jgi:hypothetical protein
MAADSKCRYREMLESIERPCRTLGFTVAIRDTCASDTDAIDQACGLIGCVGVT